MKKYLPFIFLGVGLVFLVGVVVFIRGRKTDNFDEDETVAEIPFEKRPIVKLIPTKDGHWLNLFISKTDVDGAESLDYELLYTLPDGRTQGVPGTIKLTGENISRELLLGSESSGKFRYDEGVERGTFSIKFRNSKGKLAGKLETEWILSDSDEIVSTDKVLEIKLSESLETFFVVMQTFGVPESLETEPPHDPYGVFTSYEGSVEASVTLNGESPLHYDSKWVEYEGELNSLGENFFIKP